MTDSEFADNVVLASENASGPFVVTKGNVIAWNNSEQTNIVATMQRTEGLQTHFEIDVSNDSLYSITSVELT